MRLRAATARKDAQSQLLAALSVGLAGEGDTKIETLLEQLRQRQLSVEQVETYERQRVAAEKRKMLFEAEALADMQTELTNARVNVQVAESHGEAELALARKKAEQTVVAADGELGRSRRQAEQTVVLAEADGWLRVEYTGGRAPVAQALGLEEFDYGVYQGWAPLAEVENLTEVRV